jgi:glycosyltransferase involved in cell wall biosynthesis
MKVLFVSRLVDPAAPAANQNVVRQARSLRTSHGVEVEFLTWPGGDLWSGPVPPCSNELPEAVLRVDREGLPYHVINPPAQWDGSPNVLNEHDWEAAVTFGVKLLVHLAPDVVHQHHRHAFWWMLEAAQRAGIKTVYTNYDWGIACLRTVLVMGDGALCNGVVAVEKCAQCIAAGRSRWYGRLNETAVRTAMGRRIVDWAFRTPLHAELRRRGAVQLPIMERVTLNDSRMRMVLSRLDRMVVASDFGRSFFRRLGVPAERVSLLRWPHDPSPREMLGVGSRPFTLTFIGRVSPEKGLHVLLEALARVSTPEPIHLRVVGANDTRYSRELRSAYATEAGAHRVEWIGWEPAEPYFLSSDAVAIPSTCIDNTPLTLMEAMSYRVPVIGTAIPPIAEVVSEGVNGYMAEYGSASSFANAICRAYAAWESNAHGDAEFPRVLTLLEYTSQLRTIYELLVPVADRRCFG